MFENLIANFNSIFKNDVTTSYGHHHVLPDVLTILFFSILVVLLFKKIKLSPVIGYIVAGALIGPFGLNLAGYNDVTKSLAEFGVVFLLFIIGLELTMNRLMAMKGLIFGLGSLQFILTSLAFGIISYGITKDITLSAIIGTGLALSSTAIVLKLLADTHQANSPTGKISLSILLLQDLAVVPLFIIIPLLGESDVNYLTTSIVIVGKSFIALTIIILAGRFLLKPTLHAIASSKHDDLFIAATLFVVLSSAWVTNSLGLSLALGAFIAGIMIAETEFQHQVKSTIEPFKGLFLGFFFITEIGMHFDLTLIAENFFIIILLAIMLIMLKTIFCFLICIALKNKISISLNTALLVSQTGEFAFVLFEMATHKNIMDDTTFQNLSLVVGISMAITPLLAAIGKKVEDNFSLSPDLMGKKKIPQTHNHVIVVGYGRVGKTVANILKSEDVSYLLIDSDNKLVAKHFKDKEPIYLGDITELKFLKSLNLDSAAAIVLTISDPKILSKASKIIKRHFPELNIVVRAYDMEHAQELEKTGARIIIPEIQELGLQISKKVLIMMGEHEDNAHETIEEYRNKELKYSTNSI